MSKTNIIKHQNTFYDLHFTFRKIKPNRDFLFVYKRRLPF